MHHGNQETLWKGRNIKMSFCLWLGQGHWDEFHHLASIQKGLLSFMMQPVKYQQSWTVLSGLWRTALLFTCKWAASNSMTTEAIYNGGIGWNPHCKHAQMQECNTGPKTIISTQWCIRENGDICVKSWCSKLTLCRLFVFLLWILSVTDAPYWTCHRHQKTSSCNYSVIIATSQIIIRGWQNSEAAWKAIDLCALSLWWDQESKTWNLLSSWKF